MPDNPYQAPAANLAMPDDPYQAPAVDLTAPPESRQPGALWKAVLAGVLIDFGGSILAGTVFQIIYAFWLGLQQYPLASISAELATMGTPLSAYWFFAVAVGLLMSILGAYVCARIAHRPTLRPVYLLAALVFVLGTLLGGMPNGWPLFLIMSASSVGCSIFGGWLYQRRHWPARQYQPPHTPTAID